MIINNNYNNNSAKQQRKNSAHEAQRSIAEATCRNNAAGGLGWQQKIQGEEQEQLG